MMPVRIFTEAGDGGQLAVVHGTGGDSTVYRFSTTQEGGEKTATLQSVIGAAQGDDVADAVRDALEARGYTVETDTARTDGGDQDDDVLQERVRTLRDALEAAADATPSAREQHVKTALGEVAYLDAREDVQATDLHGQLLNVVGASEEEVPYFLNQASGLLDHLEADIQQRGEDDG